MNNFIHFISVHWGQIRVVCGCLVVAFLITVCIVEKLDGTDKKGDKSDFPDWPL